MSITDLVYIDSAGYHYSDYPSFLAWIQDQYRNIYGQDVYLESDSQDGQFLAILAQSYYDMAALGASVYNSFSPVTAQGVGLSRNVKINGISRGIATNSAVDLLVVGQSGTVITNGVAQDTLNQKWNLPATVTIPGGGSITVTALADDVGAISAIANSVTTIFTPTLGWQTVNNVAAATPGAPVESDAELRIRQQESVAIPSLTVLEGQVGAVANLTGVTKVRGYENDTDVTNGNGLPPHSVSLVVDGGDAIEVANTIAAKKTPGAGTYGTTSELVYDNHGVPILISFFRPTIATIAAQMTISANQGWSSDYIAQIQQAVADTINAGAIGDTVLITKLYAPAYLTGTPASATFDIVTLTLNKNGGSYANANVSLLFNEEATCLPASVVVTVT